MSIHRWIVNENDRAVADELLPFLPPRIFDMHAHIYTQNFALPGDRYLQHTDIATIKSVYQQLLGTDILAGGLMVPYPVEKQYFSMQNRHVAKCVCGEKTYKGLMLVSPQDTYEASARFLEENPNIIGLKPYFWYSDFQPADQSPIESYLPRWCWELANERNLILLIHLARDKSLSDAQNIDTLKRMCSQYGNARIILAHIGRSFCAPYVKEGAQALRSLSNIWFDMAAICEAEPIMHLLRYFGTDRLLWGSDFPDCTLRGRAVTAGANFFWLLEDSFHPDQKQPDKLIWIMLESLRALKATFELLDLSEGDKDAIFYSNAVNFLGIG